MKKRGGQELKISFRWYLQQIFQCLNFPGTKSLKHKRFFEDVGKIAFLTL
jgi:hypothetical protein